MWANAGPTAVVFDSDYDFPAFRMARRLQEGVVPVASWQDLRRQKLPHCQAHGPYLHGSWT